MTDLAEFLLARIAEDEAAARARDPLAAAMSAAWPGLPDGITLDEAERRTAAGLAAAGIPDPGRVLRKCEADRLIVEDQSGSYTWREEFSARPPSVRSWGPSAPDRVEVSFDGESWTRMRSAEFTERYMEPSPPSRVLRLLALPYADHPDWREDWRP